MKHAIRDCWVRLGEKRIDTHCGYLQYYRENQQHNGQRLRYISSLVVQTSFGPRALFVSWKVGVVLYRYIYDPRHSDNLSNVYFEFDVQRDSQSVIEFRSHDPSCWITDQNETGNRFSIDRDADYRPARILSYDDL